MYAMLVIIKLQQMDLQVVLELIKFQHNYMVRLLLRMVVYL